MKKNAFTLIELLAVIIILAIIALIAVPIVINIINDTKDESVKRSIKLYLDSLEKTITQENLKAKYDPDKCIIQKNGNVICSKNSNKLDTSNGTTELDMEIKGTNPISGTIYLKDGKIIDIIDIYINEQYYGFDDNKSIILLDMPRTSGLYDENKKLTASWDELVNDYHLQVTDGVLKNVGNVLRNSEFANVKTFIISNDVKTIGYGAFNSGCNQLETIIIPDSVTKIEADAFANCTNLENITLPDNATNVAYSIFYHCENLKNLKVSPSNPKYEDRGSNAIIEKETNTLVFGGVDTIIPSSVTKIGDYAFQHRKKLKNIVIPNSVESIGQFAFDGCENLEEIIIPNSIKNIGVGAFRNCTKLESVTFEENSQLTNMESGIFSNCKGLKSIVIPNSVTSIGNSAFWRSGLTSIVLPEELTSIGVETFFETDLLSITIPSSVTSIESRAFSGCKKLENITIPKNVTKIEGGTFKNCSKLKNITIPSNIIEIGLEAFYNSGLTSATFKNTNGWYIVNTSNSIIEDNIDMTSVSTNARKLITTYYPNYWKRNTN